LENEKLLEALNGFMKTGTIWEALNITITAATPKRVVATMPVRPASMQQSGFLHTGAALTLAESLAALGTALNIEPARQMCFNLATSANHFRSRQEGVVTGEGTLFYKGRTSMVWDIKIQDEEGKLISGIRCTVEVVDRPPASAEQVAEQMETMSNWDSFIDLPRFW
jgi:uncharacterized protein (TIGR00369 family)